MNMPLMTPPLATLDRPARLARSLILKRLRQLENGSLTLVDSEGRETFGDPQGAELAVTLTVLNGQFYTRLMLGGPNGAAESYLEGEWACSDLTALIRLLLRNRDVLEGFGRGLAAVRSAADWLWHALNRNTRSGSRKNIAAHYDLGNDFFRLFLDSRLMYSSALYRTGQETLEEASEAKLRHICDKLMLTPDDHLLEVGTGWGGLAIYAARHYGCRVTTTTLSREQYEEAQRRVAEAGLDDRVTLLLEDYRDLTGTYDKVVSVEMVEAVGHQYLDTYFRTLHDRLKPGGQALIQAITIDDQRYEAALNEVDYIKRYIFPGSFIPCVSVLTSSAAQAGLRLFNLEDIGASYALTLRAWRERFEAKLDTVRALGYDERFIRMWRFYLCYCEGGFLERAISDVHLLLTRDGADRPQWLGQASHV
ncbi:cyclopropane-fatty-acyl-phospholipid synthase family protein [Hahella sp. SMD15-11]|uniref:Cyclopropane-fatty-acyl-phospholipid synthase family protein n=1 Tax=Thermohahella caldifontis TaxID=3142973 RepID=A0AB39USW5_9GAMM